MSELAELTAKMRKLVTDWIEVGGDVTGEQFDVWLVKVRAEAAAEALNKTAEEDFAPIPSHDIFGASDPYESIRALINARAEQYRGFTPMEGTKQ